MAKATKEEIKITKIILELSEEEACFIQCLTQNYIGENPISETNQEQNMRVSIFNSIKDARNE